MKSSKRIPKRSATEQSVMRVRLSLPAPDRSLVPYPTAATPVATVSPDQQIALARAALNEVPIVDRSPMPQGPMIMAVAPTTPVPRNPEPPAAPVPAGIKVIKIDPRAAYQQMRPVQQLLDNQQQRAQYVAGLNLRIVQMALEATASIHRDGPSRCSATLVNEVANWECTQPELTDALAGIDPQFTAMTTQLLALKGNDESIDLIFDATTINSFELAVGRVTPAINR